MSSCTKETTEKVAAESDGTNNSTSYSAYISIYDQEGYKYTFKAYNSGTETIYSYQWYLDGDLQSDSDNTFIHTFTSSGDYTIEVTCYNSSGAEVDSASYSIDLEGDETVNGGFTDNDKSKVIGELNDSVSGLEIPFMIKDQNGNIIYQGTTEEDGTFEVSLSSYISTGGFYNPKLYAKDYDMETGTFSSSYTLVDDDFMCDVDDNYYNPYPYCLGLVVGTYTWTYDADDFILEGLCSSDIDQLNIDIPMGYVKTFSINFSTQAGSCGSDSDTPEIYAKFWWLENYQGYKYITTSDQTKSAYYDANYIRLINESFSYNDIKIHSVTVNYSNY